MTNLVERINLNLFNHGIEADIRRRFDPIVSGRSVDGTMVVIWNTAPFLNALSGVKLKGYYLDAEKK